jgi:hypothetical protein
MSVRSFIISQSSVGIIGNRYRCLQPLDAAKKYATKILADTKKKIITFDIRETTQGRRGGG